MRRVVTIEASLWVLPKSAVADALSAAPRRTGGDDTFFPLLNARAILICKLEWWGYALLMCLQYLHDKHEVDLLRYMETDIADSIRDARRAVSASVTSNEAARLRTAVSDIELDSEDMRDYYNEFMEEDNRDAGRAMAAAFEATKKWLDEVREEQIGLMLID